MPDAIQFCRSVARSTLRARQAPRLTVDRVDALPGWRRPIPFRLFGRLGEQRVELNNATGRVELYTLDDDGLADFRGYASPTLATLTRSVLA
jgi:hypothetical protein